MPILPSGRRVELSQDRFLAHLAQLDLDTASRIYHALQEPDDLLFLLDVIYFAPDGSPFHADFVAGDWRTHAEGWSEEDRAAFQDWLFSDDTRQARAESLSALKKTMDEMHFPA